jgi:hypothetical protein
VVEAMTTPLSKTAVMPHADHEFCDLVLPGGKL